MIIPSDAPAKHRQTNGAFRNKTSVAAGRLRNDLLVVTSSSICFPESTCLCVCEILVRRTCFAAAKVEIKISEH